MYCDAVITLEPAGQATQALAESLFPATSDKMTGILLFMPGGTMISFENVFIS